MAALGFASGAATEPHASASEVGKTPAAESGASKPWNGFDVSNASVPAKKLVAGGPRRDAIHSVDQPKFADPETAARWVAPSNPLYSYEFYEDPSFMPGPLFRYTGFAVHVGGVVPKTIGRYWTADGRGPFLAASLHTWDHNPEFLVAESDTQIAHATEHFNGMPTVLEYRAVTR